MRGWGVLLDGRPLVGRRLRRQGIQKRPPMHMLQSFLRCERGATAIEYAIIAGGIALAIVAGVAAIGTPLNNTFTSVAGSVK